MEDPYEPVEGVTLEAYAAAAVATYGVADEEREAVAQRHGIPAGRLGPIAEEWNRRMGAHPEVVVRYSAAYQDAMRAAGIEAPDISFEQYAEILKRQQSEPVATVVADYGLDLQTFALVSQRWGEAIAADPTLAVKLAGLLAGDGS